MKRKLNSLLLALALSLSPGVITVTTLAPLALTQTGCKALAPEADPIAVRAEQAIDSALEAMNLYVNIEKDNRTLLWSKSHDFKMVADKIRAQGLNWVESAENTLDAYKASRDELHASHLNTALDVLKAALTEVQQYTDLALKTIPVKTP